MKITIKHPKKSTDHIINNIEVPTNNYNIKFSNTIDLYNNDKPTNVLILGSGYMGKSSLLMYLVEKYFGSKNHICTLYTNSSHIDHYKDHKHLIIRNKFNHYDSDSIESMKYINSKTKNKYNFVNIFDDIIDTKHKEVLDKCFLYYRNSNLTTILSTQYKNLVEPRARTNVQSVCFFGFNDQKAIEGVIEEWLDSYFQDILEDNNIKPTMKEKVRLYNYLTNDHRFIYLVPCKRHIEFIKLKL